MDKLARLRFEANLPHRGLLRKADVDALVRHYERLVARRDRDFGARRRG